MRSVQANTGPSTTRAKPAGNAMPPVRASYRGLRQATVSTMNEMARAADAAARKYSTGIGRSLAPPMP